MTLSPTDPRHGCASTYRNHGCRCQPCRAAHAGVHRIQVSRKKAIPDHVHGTLNGYRYYHCRCSECVERNRADAREVYDRTLSAKARGSTWADECKRGHKRNEENTYRRRDGRTMCRICNQIRTAAWRENKQSRKAATK